MKRIHPFFFLLVFCINVNAQQYLELIEQENVNFFEVQREAEKYFKNRDKGRGSGYKQYKRWEYIHQKEVDENGFVIKASQVWQEQNRFMQEWQASQQSHFRGGGNKSLTGNWQSLGPYDWNRTSGWNPGVGRIVCIDVDDNNQNLIYVGSPSGGLWRSTDGGSNWTVLTDNFPVMDIWSVEIDPSNSNIVYMGTAGGGILKTTDGGNSWNPTGSISGTIRDILVHPTNNNIVFATKSNGVFRSNNGGGSWTRVSAVRAEDIMFKPGDLNTVYACGRDFQRSTDGGLTWTTINSGITASERMKMAVSPANPNYVYIVQKSGNVFGRVYRSTNSGQSFVIRAQNNGSNTNYLGYEPDGTSTIGQASRDMAITVSPTNADEIMIAGIIIFKSTDGGANYTAVTDWHLPNNIGYVHADVEVLMHVGNTVYTGTDGGIYKSTDNGSTWTDLTAGLGIRQFYRIGCSQTDSNVVSGGSQDNGTSLMRSPSQQWVDWLGADGMETFVDYTDANIIYGTSQYGSMYKSVNQGNSRTSIAKPAGVGNGEWVTPFEMDPINPNTIYVGFDQLYKNTNGGMGGPSSWTAISSFSGVGNMDELCLAPSDPNYIYTAFGSQMYMTSNGGTSWTNINEPWAGIINYISVDPNNPQRVAVAVSGGMKVYISNNGGTTWLNITLNLPSIGANCVLLDGQAANGIYIGMQSGIYYKDDNLSTWIPFLTGLPKVRVEELEIMASAGKIRAGTYGRGLWESDVYSGNSVGLPPSANFYAQTTSGLVNNPIQFLDNSTGNPTSWSWSFPGGTPSTSTLENPIISYSNGGTYDVSLIASNANGSDTIIFSNYISIAAFCIPDPSQGTFFADYINGVALGSINNQNTGATGGPSYNDYSNLSTNLSQGSTQSLSIQSGAYFNDYYAAWIDFNHDNDFDDPGEKLGEVVSNMAFQNLNLLFTVPPGAILGNTTLRVRCVWNAPNMNPCTNYAYGETEDYSINITPASVCVPTYSVGTSMGDYIDGVNFGSMVNSGTGSAGGPDYTDYGSMNCDIEKGTTHNLIITGGSYAIDYYAAWIDWNKNGDYTDPGEKLGQFRTSFPFEINTIPVPVNLLVDTGLYNMRVRCSYNAANMHPCTQYVRGETEDYQIRVVSSNDLCTPPLAPLPINDSVCDQGILNVGVSGTSGPYYWYNSLNSTQVIHTGTAYSTGLIDSTETFYVAANAEDAGHSASTFFNANNGASGNLFNITSAKNIRIEGFDVNLDGSSTKEVAVYYRLGGYEGFETSSQDWTLLGIDTVIAQGSDNPTFVDIGGLTINQEETYGILIHTTQGGIRYTTMTQDSLIANNDIIIKVGKGMGSLFGSVFSPRAFNGTVHYIKYAGCESNRVPVIAKVNPLPQIEIDSIPVLCPGDGSVVLSANIPGGVFSGTGVNGNTFDPQLAGTGDHEIIYSYTNSSGCIGADTVSARVRTAPSVSLSSFSPICENESPITLSGGLPAGGTYSGAGVINGNFDPSLISIGVHSITYQYTEAGGCSASVSANINVLPAPIVSFSTSAEYCDGASPEPLSGASPSGGVYFGSGVSGSSFDPIAAGIGAHSIGYSFQSGNGCSDTAYSSISVHALPNVTHNTVNNFCESDSAALITCGNPLGGIYQGQGMLGNSFDPQLSGAGAFNISYSYTDLNGCTDSVQFVLNVHSNPIVTFDSTFETCLNASLMSIEAGFPIGGTYSGTGVNGAVFDPSASGIGTFSLYYFYTDSNGCAGLDSGLVDVHDIPIVTLNNLGSICENDAGLTLNGGLPSGGSYSGFGVNNGVFDPTMAEVGLVSISYLYSDSNGCSNTATSDIQVKTAPAANFSFSSNYLQTTFMDSSVNAQSVVWEFGDGDTSSSLNPVHTYAKAGSYSVCLTAENDGCPDQLCQDVSVITALTQILDNDKIHVYPNPFASELNYEIYTDHEIPVVMELFDLRGTRILMVEKVLLPGSNKGILQASDVAAGTYILKISSDENVATQKLEKLK